MRGLQEYIDVVRDEGINHAPVVALNNALVISSADCERGFSQMNILATSIRSSLAIKTLSSLMFIKCVGPPPRLFDPSPFTKTWITKNHVLSDNNKARKRKIVEDDHDYCFIWKKLKEC